MTCQILIVDDSALIRGSIRSVIEDQTGWRVCGEAENGEIAVQKISESNPTLVILDFQMPVMNGLEAAREISRIAPKLPMLMFTMHRSEQLETAAKAVGISCVVSKSGGQLDDLISSIINILQEVRDPPRRQRVNRLLETHRSHLCRNLLRCIGAVRVARANLGCFHLPITCGPLKGCSMTQSVSLLPFALLTS